MYLEGELGLKVLRSTFVVGLGRSIGPLVKYYKATGYGAALDLAIVLKDKSAGRISTKTATTTARPSGRIRTPPRA